MVSKNDSSMLLRARAVVSREAGAVLKVAPQINKLCVCRSLKSFFHCARHILVTGVGTLAAVAARFAHLLSVRGTPAIYINTTDFLDGHSGAIRSKDILYVFSKGGQSDEVNELVKIARALELKVVAQTE